MPPFKNTLRKYLDSLPIYQDEGDQALKFNLDNIIELLNALDNPENKFKSVHIAGTNGKGSTAHILASLLQHNDLRVGLYTSPHYLDFKERIKIDSNYITEEEVLVFLEKYQDLIVRIEPSFFEVSVAMAFDHFSRHKVDIAIIETGLGGRLDSTNVVKPLLSLITNVDYDHQHLLGDTLEEIAREKAGIIKKDTPVLIGDKNPDLVDLFQDIASANNAPLRWVEDEIDMEIKESSLDKLVLNLRNKNKVCEIHPDIAGDFQYYNIRNAIVTYRMLNGILTGYSLSEECDLYSTALSNIRYTTAFVGRWQVLNENPIILTDSAHNEQGLRQALKQIQDYEFEVLHLVIGFLKDKEWEKQLSILPYNAQYYCVSPNIPRGLDPEVLHKKVVLEGHKSHFYDSIEAGIDGAIKNASEYDLIYIGGSTFVTAEALHWWNRRIQI